MGAEFSGSGYVHVEEGRSTPSAVQVDEPEGVLFIDVVAPRAGGWEGEVADQLRFIDESLLWRKNYVILRVPSFGDPAGISLLTDVIERRAQEKPILGQVLFTAGEPMPAVQWSIAEVTDTATSAALATARSVELAAMIISGKAHWQPSTFHYRLPSGRHRADFIRVGDIFRTPRDARALATWLYGYVDTGRAIILDTSTLLPLAMALQDAGSAINQPLGPVVVRDTYPDSLLSDQELIELTVGANGALAILSVSASGDTLASLGTAFGRKGIRDWWLETLVDRSRRSATELPTVAERKIQSGVHDPWTQILDAEENDEDNCPLCRDPKRSPYVRIDPGSFSNTALSEPSTISMPDAPLHARDIESLLEMYRDVDGIGIDCDPAERTRQRRMDRRWAVRFYPHLLLTHPDFLIHAAAQLDAPRGDQYDGRYDLRRIRDFDAIAFLDTDADTEGRFLSFLDWLSETLSVHPVRHVALPASPSEDHAPRLTDALAGCSNILVVTVGTVTGGTLHELRSRINVAKASEPKGSFIVSGLVIHARPPSFREWRSARSGYANRLVSLWMTYLPSQDHPLADEQRLFRQTLDDRLLNPQALEFSAKRRAWILNNPHSDWIVRRATWDSNSGDFNPAATLLCADPGADDADLPKLQPNSKFGHRMSMIGTVVGVGAVLHRARLEREDLGGPPGVRFDMTRIPSVYFEVPIIAAVLRWIKPFEAFWEYDGRPAEEVLREVWHQAEFGDEGGREMLLAELFLAAAASKLPRHTYDVIAGFWRSLETAGRVTPGMDVYKQLLEEAWGPMPATD